MLQIRASPLKFVKLEVPKDDAKNLPRLSPVVLSLVKSKAGQNLLGKFFKELRLSALLHD